MPVEMRLEDAEAPVRAPARGPAFAEPAADLAPKPTPEPFAGALAEPEAESVGDGPDAAPDESAPTALRDLIAARLVTHEVIGDPARLGTEPATLRALCGLVAGPVYRLEPFHYAFAARPGDLGGALEGRDAAERTEALGAALAAALGPEAVWLGATDLLPEANPSLAAGPEAMAGPPAEAAAPAPEALPEAALLVLRAQDGAVAAGLAAADPGLRAVIDAHLAVEAARRAADLAAALGLETASQAAARDVAARRAADLEAAALDRRLAAIEARLETLLETGMALRAAAPDAEAQAARLAAQARETRAFEARLGLALAEFLARLERRASAPAPVS